MLPLVTAPRGARFVGRFVTLSLSLAPLGGCNAKDTSGASKSANAQTWAPDKLTSIQDIPATEVETLIQQKLDGPRLPKIDDDQCSRSLLRSRHGWMRKMPRDLPG